MIIKTVDIKNSELIDKAMDMCDQSGLLISSLEAGGRYPIGFYNNTKRNLKNDRESFLSLLTKASTERDEAMEIAHIRRVIIGVIGVLAVTMGIIIYCNF